MALKKIALVIGNSAYVNKPLRNPTNDAEDIAAKLTGYGFSVIKETDFPSANISDMLEKFKDALSDAHIALFFFAGHGVQVKGKNYLLSVDVDTRSESSTKNSSISLDEIIEIMRDSTVSTKIVILDACRNDPISHSWSRSTLDLGLASVYAPKGTIIAFGTSPGEIALDGTGRNGRFTEALLEHIDAQNCPIETMFKKVRNSLAANTDGQQTSWEHTSLSGEFIFNISITRVITEYSETALADSQFDLSRNSNSIKIIKGLKSLNWYTQRDSLKLLTAENVDKMMTDNLFVIGRNIYQAACGECKDAKSYIYNFKLNTDKFDSSKQHAILDGILFEIFFDSLSNLRKKIKGDMFNAVFELNRNGQFPKSFNFIALALSTTNARFYTLPGTRAGLQVNISSERVAGGLLIKGVYIGGADVLHPIDDSYLDKNGCHIHYERMKLSELQETLSIQLVVPLYLLDISFTESPERNEKILFPMNTTVRIEP